MAASTAAICLLLIAGTVLAADTVLTWTRVVDSEVFPDGSAIQTVAVRGSTYVALGGIGPESAAAWYSTDGRAWQRADSVPGDPRGTINAVTVTAEGFLAAGFRGQSDRVTQVGIWHSSDGRTWEIDPPDADFGTDDIEAVIRGRPGFVAVGGTFQADGAAWFAEDGREWTRTDDVPFASTQVHDVVAGGPGYVAVGEDLAGETALVWTSRDGLSWQREAVAASFGQLSRMVSVADYEGVLVAVGERGEPEELTTHGAIWTSTDGSTWVRIADDASFRPFGGMHQVHADAAGLVVAGQADGSARTWSSIDAVTWTPDPIGQLSDARIVWDLAASSSVIVASGNLGFDVIVDRDTDGLWFAERAVVQTFARSVAGPLDISTDPVVIAAGVAAAAGVALLVPFPSGLFNSTLEAHYTEIMASLRRFFRWGGRTWKRLGRFWERPVGIAAFAVVAALMYGFLDPTFGLDPESFALFLGLLVGLIATTLAFALPGLLYHRRVTGETGRLRPLPATILIGLVCVLISRATSFQPGYLYGLILGFGFVRDLPRADEGRATALAAGTTLSIAALAWVALLPIRSLPPDLLITAAEAALTTIVVAGLEGVTFGLLPMRFLAGEKLFAWNRRLWVVLFGLGAFAFLHILVNPESGYLADSARTPLVTILGLLIAFGTMSVLLWAYFRYRRTRPATR